MTTKREVTSKERVDPRLVEMIKKHNQCPTKNCEGCEKFALAIQEHYVAKEGNVVIKQGTNLKYTDWIPNDKECIEKMGM